MSCVEFNTLHLWFALVFFVSGGVLATTEAHYKKSLWMAVSSGVIWLSLIGIIVSICTRIISHTTITIIISL